MNANVKYRVGKSKLAQALIVLFAFIITLPLIFIILYIFREGITKINWNFLTNIPKPVGEAGGGIVNALIGSIMIVLAASVMAIPVGIMGGIYLSENKTSRLSYWSRLSVDVLQGVPSIVIGIVVYFWVVKPIGTFLRIFGKCCPGHHDASHPDPLYGRNPETDSILFKGSRTGPGASLS